MVFVFRAFDPEDWQMNAPAMIAALHDLPPAMTKRLLAEAIVDQLLSDGMSAQIGRQFVSIINTAVALLSSTTDSKSVTSCKFPNEIRMRPTLTSDHRR
jgi:hypothetical protein